MVETLVNIKMGYEELAQADQLIILSWVLMMAVASIVGLSVCVIAGKLRHLYNEFLARVFTSISG